MSPLRTVLFAISLLAVFSLTVVCGGEPVDNGDNADNEYTQNNDTNDNGDNQQNNDNGDNDDNDDNGDNDNNDDNSDNDNGDNDDNGDNGTEGLQTCTYSCETVSDCSDEGNWKCEDDYCQPTGPSGGGEVGPCDDELCVRYLSEWDGTCNSQSDCADDHLCIHHDNNNEYCAPDASEVDCHDMWHHEQQRDLVGSTDQAKVCVDTNARCDTNICVSECETDDDCLFPGGDVCYDGECGCSGDATCQQQGYDVCR